MTRQPSPHLSRGYEGQGLREPEGQRDKSSQHQAQVGCHFQGLRVEPYNQAQAACQALLPCASDLAPDFQRSCAWREGCESHAMKTCLSQALGVESQHLPAWLHVR